jgi:hypothetical protein
VTSDLAQASSFVHRLTGTLDEPLCIQLIAEPKTDHPTLRPQVLSGTLADLWPVLSERNEHGYGVFVLINRQETAGTNRKAENICEARGYLLDLDTGGEKALRLARAMKVKPHLTIESSPGRYQCVYLVEGTPMFGPEFKAYKDCGQGLAEMFGGDPTVAEPARVMRLPGLYHRKRGAVMVQLIDVAEHAPYEFGRFKQFAHPFEREIRLEAERARKAPAPVRTHAQPTGEGRKWTARGTGEGGRNLYVYNVSVAAAIDTSDPTVVMDRALQAAAACSPPLPEDEAKAAARSAWRTVTKR